MNNGLVQQHSRAPCVFLSLGITCFPFSAFSKCFDITVIDTGGESGVLQCSLLYTCITYTDTGALKTRHGIVVFVQGSLSLRLHGTWGGL